MGDPALAVVAANVAHRRKVAGLAMRDVASVGGCSASVVHDAEHARAITVLSLGKLAIGLGCTMADLVSEPACGHCRDLPWRGYTCNSCGASGG